MSADSAKSRAYFKLFSLFVLIRVYSRAKLLQLQDLTCPELKPFHLHAQFLRIGAGIKDAEIENITLEDKQPTISFKNRPEKLLILIEDGKIGGLLFKN